ncbi:MAG: nucleotidyltransferase substrate binding protein [Candidatus Thiosymbion ectosymbiont of Robbea hypermnestra]|nr:nucleotidyltransferase substrate binding protein [Candidatus Thiosymbion ectosymbiont of Robbea hypermnestra]
MSGTDELRWQQRLENFGKAISQLEAACNKEKYSDLERAGLVQIFGFSFELAWKIFKDLLFSEGYDEKTPRSIIRRSFEVEYLSEEDTEVFLDVLTKRNLLSHTYKEEAAETAVELIKQSYFPVLKRAYNTLKNRQNT